MKDEFMGVLGHELRNPLAPIVTALHLMAMRGVSGVEREHRILDRQVGQLVRLVDELLDVSRVLGGRLVLHRSPVLLAEAVAQAVEATAPIFEANRHRVSIDLPPGGLELMADGARLTQIIANLLTHAAQHALAASEVRILVQRSQVDREEKDAMASIAVEYDGPHPISGEPVNLFETVGRPPPRHQRSGPGGLGLGLPIARTLARRHGGDLTAESLGPGQGQRFSLTLPA